MTHATPLELNFEKGGGLIPVVVQDIKNNTVLMCAFTDRRAWEKTRLSGYAHYYSRTRNSLWMKGEQSGNRQKIREILVDCDNDTLLYRVVQEGDGACHTGHYSCFFRRLEDEEWREW